VKDGTLREERRSNSAVGNRARGVYFGRPWAGNCEPGAGEQLQSRNRWGWLDRDRRGLRAYLVPPDTPAYRAGVRTGDVLTAINDVPTPQLAALEREIDASGVWSHATYTLLRKTQRTAKLVDVPVVVYLEPTDRTDWQ